MAPLTAPAACAVAAAEAAAAAAADRFAAVVAAAAAAAAAAALTVDEKRKIGAAFPLRALDAIAARGAGWWAVAVLTGSSDLMGSTFDLE